jgi:hypothetical protein
MQKDYIFKPKYSVRMKWGFIVAGLFDIAILFWVIADPSIYTEVGFWGAIFMFLILPLFLLYFTIIKEVIISNRITVKYYLKRPLEIRFDEISDLGMTMILTDRGQVSLYGITNSQDLISQIFKHANEKMDRGEIKKEFIKGDYIRDEIASIKAIIPGAVVGSIIYFFVCVFGGCGCFK